MGAADSGILYSSLVLARGWSSKNVARAGCSFNRGISPLPHGNRAGKESPGCRSLLKKYADT